MAEKEPEARPAKRARSLECLAEALPLCQLQRQPDESSATSLLALPDGVVHHILSNLGSSELVALSATSLYFRKQDRGGLSLTQRMAKEALIRLVGLKQAMRWRSYSWLQRLIIEETFTKFDRELSEKQAFGLKEAPGTGAVSEIKLEVPGPRMLVSDISTAQSPVLRWKLQLRGNNAAEFGVVPVDLQELPKALHKCSPNKADERATGFSSAITVGSLLPARLPIMKGTVVEMLVTPREVAFIISNPEDGAEMIWQNNATVSRAYKGPQELRLQLSCKYTTPVKLAVTAWQRAAFDVLHLHPGQAQRSPSQPQQQQPLQQPLQPQQQQPQQQLPQQQQLPPPQLPQQLLLPPQQQPAPQQQQQPQQQ